MLSSHSFYKQSEMIEEELVKKIETNYTIKKKPIINEEKKHVLEKPELDIVISKHQEKEIASFNQDVDRMKKKLKKIFKNERDKFFSELRELKTVVIDQAKLEGETLKEEAYQEGLKEGQLDGYNSGLENGYQAGLKEAEELKKNSLLVIEQAKTEIENYQKEKQHEFLELASIMAETIINRELTLSKTELQYLLDPIMNKLDKTDNFITVFVTKVNQDSTNEYMKNLKETFSDLKYAVLIDESLERNGCVIETSYEVIDLQLRKQLDLMIEELSKGGNHD